MPKLNAKNERLKHAYIAYLRDAKGMAPETLDATAAAISQFAEANGGKDFALFHVEHAKRFKRVLEDARNHRTGRPLSRSTIRSRLMAVKAFIEWLAGRPGFRKRFTHADAEYFSPSERDSRIATARRQSRAPNLDDVREVILAMPAKTAIERRDRALIAFTLLSGARVDAIASMSLRHVDLERRSVDQDARTVRTKNARTFTSVFFPVGEEVEAVVTDWINWLETVEGFGPDDPLFPSTRVVLSPTGGFVASGLDRKGWNSTAPIRRIFKQAFAAAGQPYCNPHALRKTLVALGERTCRTPEEFKAWSQNLGHEAVLTTFRAYGEVSWGRQSEIMAGKRGRGLAVDVPIGGPSPEIVGWVLDHLRGRAVG